MARLADEALANLVSNVTQPMLGLHFAAVGNDDTPEDLKRHAALLFTDGRSPLAIGISSNDASCVAIGAALFACAPETVDASMMNDSLREILNMAAGQIKNSVAAEQALGLPKMLANAETELLEPAYRRVAMRSGAIHLVIWISAGSP